MTQVQLMAATGWSEAKLRRICWATTWGRIDAVDIDTYLSACGLTWSRLRRPLYLLRLAIKRGGVETMRHIAACGPEHGGAPVRYLRRLNQILLEGRERI